MEGIVILVFIIALFTILSGVRIISQFEKGIVLRLGKYKNVVEPGLNIIIPYIDSIVKVDIREKVISVEPQEVITKDNVTVTVDAVIYYKVVDPVKAKFEVEDFDLAATTLAQTNLRNVIGDKTLDETLTARDVINTSLRDTLDEATQGWGVKVTRVEVQKIDPPVGITEAMSLQMRAEREKRATILSAEGIKLSLVLQAEGAKNSAILKAEGEATAIQKISEAANKFFDEKAQAWQRMQVSQVILANNTKFVIPTSSEVVNVLNLDGKDNIVPVQKK